MNRNHHPSTVAPRPWGRPLLVVALSLLLAAVAVAENALPELSPPRLEGFELKKSLYYDYRNEPSDWSLETGARTGQVFGFEFRAAGRWLRGTVSIATFGDTAQARAAAMGGMIVQTSLEPGFPPGSLTGAPLGRESWRYRPPSDERPGSNWSVDLFVLDDGFFVLGSVLPQPVDPAARGVRFPAPPNDLPERVEGAVRELVSRAHFARTGLDGTANVTPLLTGARTAHGVTTGRLGGKQVLLAAGGREAIVDGARVPLTRPVIGLLGQVWISFPDLRKILGQD